MGLKTMVTNYLKQEVRFRERKNKDRGIVNLLVARYPSLFDVDKKILVKAVKDYNSMDRSWRQILEKRPELRGSDYNEKDSLELRKMKELGYDVSYPQEGGRQK